MIGLSEGKDTITEQNTRIDAGQHKSWEFLSDGSLTLHVYLKTQYWTFSAYLLDEENYLNLIGDSEFEYITQASTIYEAELKWDVPEGKHYFVIVNNFDDLAINLNITIRTQEGPDGVCCGSIVIGSLISLGVLFAFFIVVKRKLTS